MDQVTDGCRRLKLNQKKKRNFLIDSQNKSSSQSFQNNFFSSENEIESCPAEVLSLESDFGSNNGGVDSSDQNEFLGEKKEKYFTEKSDKNKEYLNGEYLYGTPPRRNCFKNNEKEQQNKSRASLLNSTKIINNGNSEDYYKNAKFISQRMECFEDTDMKYAELTHQKLKRTLNDLHLNGNNNSKDVTLFTNSVDDQVRYETHNGNNTDFQNIHTNQLLLPDHITTKQQNEFHDHAIASSFPSYNYVPSATNLDAILHIKDEMLEEKESAIMKLKIEIASLQHQLKESQTTFGQVGSSPLHHFRIPANHSLSSDPNLHIKEKKIFELEQLLGKTENKLLEITTKYENKKKEMAHSLTILTSTIKTKEQSCIEAKKKYKLAVERLEKYRHRVESLEQYLGDLPTIEENSKIKNEARVLGEERKNLVIENAEYKAKLERNAKTIRKHESKVESLENDLKTKINLIEKLHDQLDKSKKSKEALGRNERDDLEDLRSDFNRLQKSKNDISKLLSASEKRMKLLEEKHEREVDMLKSNVKDAEELAENSRRDVFMKQQASKKINTAVKSLSSQNQQLLDQNLNLQAKVKSLEKLNSNFNEVSRTYCRVERETHLTVKDLRGVAQVLIQTADGADPDISALLGVRSDSSCLEDMDEVHDEGLNQAESSWFSVDEARKRLFELRQLRKDIDQLRTSLSNRYADAIGDNCVTQ